LSPAVVVVKGALHAVALTSLVFSVGAAVPEKGAV